MESFQWIIAVSTALIAVILMVLVVLLIKLQCSLGKEVRLLSQDVEKKVESLDNSWREMLNLSSFDSKEPNCKTPRILPKILRGVIFGTALWNNFQKRR